MEYRVNDRALEAASFLALVGQIWQGDYDAEQARDALSRTYNITAYDGAQLVGCLRILTDGHYFGTITELLVLPAYQRQGIGSKLLRLAQAHTPTMLYFGAQPGLEAFYEKTAARRACNHISYPGRRADSLKAQCSFFEGSAQRATPAHRRTWHGLRREDGII